MQWCKIAVISQTGNQIGHMPPVATHQCGKDKAAKQGKIPEKTTVAYLRHGLTGLGPYQTFKVSALVNYQWRVQHGSGTKKHTKRPKNPTPQRSHLNLKYGTASYFLFTLPFTSLWSLVDTYTAVHACIEVIRLNINSSTNSLEKAFPTLSFPICCIWMFLTST